ncbi:S-methyl-5'-thioadenosine phosphorylase [Aristophania vespae]|uniref:S-methyl-5'-thioadenosine phosphorylase n=1 Tax=Aristophania vespae TaxID=2697033 RepID=A0A6P1NIB1_9PROT|nr:S-methyl-5'-thioadenosine phosphorylase [Aristophania vespae]QHI95392.1 S-methyl-5'-thioadenosine phosphorylase [Aristophania vespae]UMM64671.1 S-methyl-5'-thioadenosine phosphorylase [Aristophania vespae]
MAENKMVKPVIGVIGGSGLYEIDGLKDRQWRRCETPWGEPSDELLFGTLDGVSCVFLPRHGRGHPIPPSELNFRANIAALKKAGVTDILSLSAVGSLKEELEPGRFVLVDQFIDLCQNRKRSFFEKGCVAHVGMADPVSHRLLDVLEKEAHDLSIPLKRGGTYVVIEGPQFSTRAESELYRSWGCSVIGMTNMPEARLAREAEMNYATVAMVTDYDCWHDEHEAVTVEAVIKIMQKNADHARALIKAAIPVLGQERELCSSGAERALDNAIITAPQARDEKVVETLKFIADRVL